MTAPRVQSEIPNMELVLQARTLKYLPERENDQVLNNKVLKNCRERHEEGIQQFVSLFSLGQQQKKVVSLVLLQTFG